MIAERDCSNEEAASKKNIPTDVINQIKEHGVGWSSAEVYDGYVAGKNIYYCSQAEKITKNYPYSTKKAKSTEIDPNESNADRLPNASRVEEDNPIEITRDTLFERTGIIPAAESALKLPVGALEIPKQLLVGGIAGLAIGAGCEFSGKYLGEGIGYLCYGSKGAAHGEAIGENVGVFIGMILPFVIFV